VLNARIRHFYWWRKFYLIYFVNPLLPQHTNTSAAGKDEHLSQERPKAGIKSMQFSQNFLLQFVNKGESKLNCGRQVVLFTSLFILIQFLMAMDAMNLLVVLV
jgi:hypothetical protein